MPPRPWHDTESPERTRNSLYRRNYVTTFVPCMCPAKKLVEPLQVRGVSRDTRVGTWDIIWPPPPKKKGKKTYRHN